MIPDDWMPHRRADGEVVGFVRQVGEAFQPMDLFGRPLGDPSDWLAVEEALDAHTIAWIDEPWLLEVDGADVRVRVVEVTPARIRVKLDDFGDVTASARFWEVPLPERGCLRPAPPATEWPSR
ncbi:hypothetical protein [Agrococcus carbonis]|uniref:Uncharacterized protein n=1 Tax=Agrococcus carbonis TaxID=684552 RepID=A0A1H1N8P1_9MICO|nr:hypothetical protein [Agrococcus carbonis]SDR95362.1 hypothetical protein SAMN04489719_1203 [Agrococcus carbonis]